MPVDRIHLRIDFQIRRTEHKHHMELGHGRRPVEFRAIAASIGFFPFPVRSTTSIVVATAVISIRAAADSVTAIAIAGVWFSVRGAGIVIDRLAAVIPVFRVVVGGGGRRRLCMVSAAIAFATIATVAGSASAVVTIVGAAVFIVGRGSVA